MLANDSSLAVGHPRFSGAGSADIAQAEGSLAAWRDALEKDATGAALGASGDFAVGLNQPGGRTFLAVDRFAIRTLCYRVDKGQLRFAARADELSDENTEIDPQAIFDYLYFHVIPSPRTIYKGIYRLPPGHHATFENGKLTVSPYWITDFPEEKGASFDSLKDEFRRILHEAVSSQLDGSKPACFLSGGTDSSTIAGMATLASGQTVSSYSIGFKEQGYDEMEFARLASRHFQTDHHEYYVTPDDLVRSIPGVAASSDQPFGNSSALPAYYCAKMAREDGVTKLLAGDGGDELFGGNSRYAKQRIFGCYQHLPRLIREGLVEPLLETRMAAHFGLTQKARSYVQQARSPMPDRMQMYNLVMRLGASEVLTPQLLAHVDVGRPLQLQRDVWHGAQGCSPLNQELAYDWRFTLAESDLPKVLGATALAEIEVGFPMLDERLLGFSQKLPTCYKLKGLELRWFFKEALRGFLPDEIIAKKKQGFGLPFGTWAVSHAKLKSMATDSLHGLAERGVVRMDFIQGLLTRRLSEHPAYFGEMIWILMMLENWLRARKPGYRLR